MRTSAASARFMPAPTAGPFTAAITGLVAEAMARNPAYISRRPAAESSDEPALAKEERSAPAQNAGPAPVTMSTLASPLDSNASTASTIWVTIAAVIALRRFGSSNVITTTPSAGRDRCTNGCSVMRPRLEPRRVRPGSSVPPGTAGRTIPPQPHTCTRRSLRRPSVSGVTRG